MANSGSGWYTRLPIISTGEEEHICQPVDYFNMYRVQKTKREDIFLLFIFKCLELANFCEYIPYHGILGIIK